MLVMDYLGYDIFYNIVTSYSTVWAHFPYSLSVLIMLLYSSEYLKN
jgi:hypothetical protein